MDIEELRHYCLSKKSVTEEFPFDADTLVFKVAGKMFALAPLERWEKNERTVSLKCDPDYALELRADYESIGAAYHMNKKHWNAVNTLSPELNPQLIRDLIDHSYDLVVKKLPKSKRPV